MVKTSESTTPELEAIGEQLRNAAQRLGLSRNQVAKLSGVSRKHVGAALAGGNLSLAVLVKLIRVLKIETLTFGDVSLTAQQPAIDPRLLNHATNVLDRALQTIRAAHALLAERQG